MDLPVLQEIEKKAWVGFDKFLFILSAPRSGSTLLRVLLNRLPDVISPPESYFLEFYKNNKTLNPALGKDRKIIAANWIVFRNHLNVRNLYNPEDFRALVEKEARSWADVFSILVQTYANDAEMEYGTNTLICEKTPLHIEYQKELKEIFPMAKIIYLVRDPRDVVASLKTCSWASSCVIKNAHYWSQTIKMVEEGQNRLMVKYEDLVDFPDEEFDRIGRFLDMEINEDILNSQAPNEDKESADPRNIASYKPIDNSFKEKWKTLLSHPEKELEVIETICSKEMKLMEYQLQTKFNKRLSFLLKIQRWSNLQYERIYRRII